MRDHQGAGDAHRVTCDVEPALDMLYPGWGAWEPTQDSLWIVVFAIKRLGVNP